jgi:hypothetical protein
MADDAVDEPRRERALLKLRHRNFQRILDLLDELMGSDSRDALDISLQMFRAPE